MEDLSADDDLLSDVLVDTLEFEPPVSTHKMNPSYRPVRVDTSSVIRIVRQRVVVEADLTKAVEELCNLQVIKKHLQGKTPRQVSAFQAHARRYLETYLPHSGVELALTLRYKRSPVSAPEAALDNGEGSSTGVTRTALGRNRLPPYLELRPHPIAQSAQNKADLCLLAMKPFETGELIIHCKGGIKDLTKTEDDALREEAAMYRSARLSGMTDTSHQYKGVLGPGRDFSVIRSSRKGCSQLFLGPARFVNHDCDPNAEFYRMGTQMVFKAIRPIAINEEITTFYGDNYFEWGNSECLCSTCEARSQGAFAPEKTADDASVAACSGETATSEISTTESAESSAPHEKRRHSLRRSAVSKGSRRVSYSPSPPSVREKEKEVAPPPRKPRLSAESLKALSAADPETYGASGARCQCVTCGALFFAPEKWWTPDECGRCERHYKIFKADWPGRVPTEGQLVEDVKARSAKKAAQRQKADADEEELRSGKGKGKAKARVSDTAAASNGAAKKVKANSYQAVFATSDEGSQSSTPIKLSPLRDVRSTDGRNMVGLTEESTEGASKPRKPGRPPKARNVSMPSRGSSAADADEDADVDRMLGHTMPRRRVVSAANVSRADELDSGSDLTDQESLEEKPRALKAKTKAVAEVTSSSLAETDDSTSETSSSSFGTAGPKMLGKEAHTETLAMYWGAVEGNRRVSRPSENRPVSLAARESLKKEAARRAEHKQHRQHRKSASNASAASVAGALQSMPRISKEDEMDVDEETTPRARTKRRSIRTESPDELEERVDSVKPKAASNKAPPSASPGPIHSKRSADSDTKTESSSLSSVAGAAGAQPASTDSSPVPVGLATQGPERTSVKNLAMFWSAGVGESRTRKQAQREPTTLVAGGDRGNSPSDAKLVRSRRSVTGVASSHSSPGVAAAAADDAVKGHRRARSQAGRVDDELEGASAKRESPHPNYGNGAGAGAAIVASRKINGRASASSRGSSEEGEREQRDAKRARHSDASHLGGQRLKKEEGEEEGSASPSHLEAPTWLPSNGSGTSGTPLGGAPRRPSVPSTTMAGTAHSALAGPAPTSGQIKPRKNLRWGSGKVQHSRPLPPSSGAGGSPMGTSPLGRPVGNASPVRSVGPPHFAPPSPASHAALAAQMSSSGLAPPLPRPMMVPSSAPLLLTPHTVPSNSTGSVNGHVMHPHPRAAMPMPMVPMPYIAPALPPNVPSPSYPGYYPGESTQPLKASPSFAPSQTQQAPAVNVSVGVPVPPASHAQQGAGERMDESR